MQFHGMPRGMVMWRMVSRSKQKTGVASGESVWIGMQIKVKSSTHLITCFIPLVLRMVTTASAGRPWILPEDSRLKTVQCSTHIMTLHMMATYGLCLGLSRKLQYSCSMSKVAACAPGGADATWHRGTVSGSSKKKVSMGTMTHSKGTTS